MSDGPLQSSNLKRARPASDMRLAVYVGNLPSDVSVSELEELCGEFGHVKQCDVLFQWKSSKSRRFAFVLMTTNDEALDVIDALGNTKYGGSFLLVQFWRSDVFPRRTSGNPTLYIQKVPYALTERRSCIIFRNASAEMAMEWNFFQMTLYFVVMRLVVDSSDVLISDFGSTPTLRSRIIIAPDQSFEDV